MESVEEKEQYLKESLEKLKDKYPEVCVDVRGLGLMMGLQMTIKPSVVINKCREKGVILCSAGLRCCQVCATSNNKQRRNRHSNKSS